MKTCSKCEFKGPENLFRKDGNWCKKCKSEYMKTYKKSYNQNPINRANIKASMKTYYADPINRANIKANQKTYNKTYMQNPINKIKRKQTPSYKKMLLQPFTGERRCLIEWSINVRNRDAYKCQNCGLKDKSNIAHHILPKSQYPDFKLVLSNGVCACKKCHLDVYHGGCFKGNHNT